MSLVELLPRVLSLSRSDKLRLIQTLASDLMRAEELHSESKNGTRDENDVKVREDERVQEALHAVGSRNAVGRMEEEMSMKGSDKTNIADSDQKLLSTFEARGPVPGRFPGESYEAAAALMKLLEAEKSAK